MAAAQGSAAGWPAGTETKVLPISRLELGVIDFSVADSFLHKWSLHLPATDSGRALKQAAQLLKEGEFPVAFPTETVYGLAADATSSKAVQGIYRAKNRPADNPLIVHFCHLDQLRSLLDTSYHGGKEPDLVHSSDDTRCKDQDPIPRIYLPLISKFWPGPLTILLPLPSPSPLAPEVTNSLATFGARIPSSALALALIQQVGRPLAAPSANASTRPSPTTAQHVFEDLNGRIELILDGGACDVGVESTVVDGLSDPPCVLRPGGVGIEEIRQCPGWERVVNAYEHTERSHVKSPASAAVQNGHTNGTSADSNGAAAPRAPGMKYRHYAPRAQVLLVEGAAWKKLPELVDGARAQGKTKIGLITTRNWSGLKGAIPIGGEAKSNGARTEQHEAIYEACIGPTIVDVSKGLFKALRDLDSYGVEVIFAEGRELGEGRTAEAVMNRLRKAAEAVIKE